MKTVKRIVLFIMLLAGMLACVPCHSQTKRTKEQSKTVVKSDTTKIVRVQDTVSKKKLLNLLTDIYQKYERECYRDSVLVNCYILLSSDGVKAKYDTICGVSLMLFDASGVAPVPLHTKSSYWAHKPANNDGFIKWLKKTGKEK